MEIDTCWSRIGTWGDSTCEILRKHAHCRNCNVFSKAASQVLDREVDDDYIEESARHYRPAVSQAERGTESVVLFRLGDEWFALSTQCFLEVCNTRTVHTLPHQRNPAMLGIVNVRGELLICISLATFLGVARKDVAKPESRLRDRMLVISKNGERVVLPAEEVAGIHRFHTDALIPAPVTLGGISGACTRKMLRLENRVAALLDPDALFKAINTIIV